MRDLNRHTVEQQAAQWERLGLELGLKDYHIANISANNSSHKQRQVEVCCSQMLQKWLEVNSSATWGKLDDAIKNIKLPSTISPVSTDKGGTIIMYSTIRVTNTLFNWKSWWLLLSLPKLNPSNIP